MFVRVLVIAMVSALVGVACGDQEGAGDPSPASTTAPVPDELPPAPAPTISTVTTQPPPPETEATEPASSEAPPSGVDFTLAVVEFSGTYAEVLVPTGTGPFPAAVTVHGGGYTRGSPESMRPMAELLARNGFLVFNTAYHLSTPTDPAFPTAMHDVACAMRLAASHPDSDGTVAVVGVSAGAHAGGLVAVTGDLYGDDCSAPPATATRYVGLGYIDITGTNTVKPPGLDPLFQVPDEEVSAELRAAGDPINHVGANPGLMTLLVHAEDDEITSLAAAEQMLAALTGAGQLAELAIVPGIGHFDLSTVEFTGATVVEWLLDNPAN